MNKPFQLRRFSATKLLSVASLLLGASHAVQAEGDLKVHSAEAVDMSTERLKRIDQFAQNYVDQGRYPGMVTMVARKGKVVHLNAFGNHGLADPRPMQTDTLFRIYSMTKPVTAVAAMMLYEEGKFRLDEPLHYYLPEFKDQKILVDGKEVAPDTPVTVRQLFTHTAGFTYGFTPDNPVDIAYAETGVLGSNNSDEFIERLAKIPLRFQPGTRYHYSVSMDVLGVLVERLSGLSLADYFEQRIFKPLDMHDTFFNVPQKKLNRLAGDHTFDMKSKNVVSVPAEQQRNFTDVGFFSGGGGLVSTASDYMRFSQMVLNGGSYEGTRLLGPKTVQYLSLNHLTPAVRAEGANDYPAMALHGGQSMALGYGVVTNPALMPAISSKGEISWAGVAGTKFWIDPKEELIAIVLVQLYQAPWPLRYDMKASTYQAITELND